MCTYCMIADWANHWLPDQPLPWSPWTTPTTIPVVPHTPWTREQLDQFEELLRLVKEMEDKLGGCPCEDPSKMDFLKDIRARLDRVNEQIESEKPDESEGRTHTLSE